MHYNGKGTKMYSESKLSFFSIGVMEYNYTISSSLFYSCYVSLSAGSWLLHYELLHVHLLGSVLRLPRRLPGEGLRSICLWLRDP